MSDLSSKSILDKYRQLATSQFIPLQASLELTYRCNERCTHCYIEKFWDDPNKTLSKEDWFKVLKELRAAGSLYIILMGGEAMLNPYFWDILQESTRMNFHTSMISNGLKIQDLLTAQKLKSCGLKRVTFSVYSLDKEIHDKMTSVKGSLKKTLNAIDLCKEAGLEVSINSLLTEANAKGIFDIYDWCTENNFDLNVDPNLTPKLNGDLSPVKYRASEETLLWFYRERLRRWKNSRPKASGDQPDSYVCNAGKGKCAVNPYGELLPCIEIRESLGSLIKGSFQEAWYNEKVNKWRQLKVKDLTNYENLELQNHCDHCPGMAKNEHGDSKKISCYTKQIAKVKMQVAKEPMP